MEVAKHADFRKFMVPGIPALNFNFKDSTLNGIQTNGSFKNDSINLYYFLTPDALYNYTYLLGNKNELINLALKKSLG